MNSPNRAVTRTPPSGRAKQMPEHFNRAGVKVERLASAKPKQVTVANMTGRGETRIDSGVDAYSKAK